MRILGSTTKTLLGALGRTICTLGHHTMSVVRHHGPLVHACCERCGRRALYRKDNGSIDDADWIWVKTGHWERPSKPEGLHGQLRFERSTTAGPPIRPHWQEIVTLP